MRRLAALAVIAFASNAFAANTRQTVAMVPLTSSSGAEYQWIGSALAQALAMRASLQVQLNTITVRQVNAAIRHDNLDPQMLADEASAAKLGKLVGADLLFTGSYEAAWPDITITIKVVDPWKGQVISTQ